MTSINTYEAKKFWKDETDFLRAIEFVALNDEGKISLITDEEGNNEIILTPKSALFVAEKLTELAKAKGK
jgi:hypothetical protein